MKVFAGILGGLILAALGTILVIVALLVASPEKADSWGSISFFILLVAGIVIAVRSKSAAKAWRKLLIFSAVLSFLLPLSGMITTGSLMTELVDYGAQDAGAQAVGAAIPGVLITGVMGFVGFFLGAVFLVIGLLVGRDKQVIYVQAPASPDEQC